MKIPPVSHIHRLLRPVALGCFWVALFPAQARDIYVSPNGLSSSIGESSNSPTTIQNGFHLAVVGDTILVKSGTYAIVPANPPAPYNANCIRLVNKAGITIKALSGGEAVIDGGLAPGGRGGLVPDPVKHWEWGGLIEVSDCQSITIEGLKVINSGLFGIFIRNSNDITVRNCAVDNTNYSGIYARDASDVEILGNVVQKACQYPDASVSTQECITLSNVNTFEVAGNTVFDRLIDRNNGGEGIDAKTGSSNGSIHNNLVYDLIRTGVYTDAWNRTSQNIEIYRNRVHDVPTGIAVGAEVNAGIIDDVRIFDNLIRDCYSRGIIVSNWGGNGIARNISIYNNTVTRCGKWGNASSDSFAGITVAANNPDNASGTIGIRNNILAGNFYNQLTTKGQPYVQIDRNLLSGANTLPLPPASNTISADPLFLDSANNVFRLASSSPAVNAAQGTPVSGMDITGRPRPVGAAADLGAHEYSGEFTAMGFQTEYYDNTQLTGPVLLSRREAVALPLGARSPGAGIPETGFSTRWKGAFEAPVTGSYTFRVRTNNGMVSSGNSAAISRNGVRLWIDGVLRVDRWDNANDPNVTVLPPLSFETGKRYAVKMEFFDAGGDAAAFLEWMHPGQPYFVPVPAERLHAPPRFATGFEVSDGYGANATVIGVRDPSAGGAAWIDGFATGSSVQISSTANPSTGGQALRIADGDSSKAYHAGVDLASILDGGKPFTVSFVMAVSGVSPGTGHQAQVSLGTKNAAFEPSWFSVIYHDGNLIVLVDNASHSSTSAVNLGSYANYSPLGQHVKFDITIDPITRRYVSFVVTGSTSGKVDKTAAVQTGASLGGLPLQGSATAPYWLNFITGSNDTVTVDFDDVAISMPEFFTDFETPSGYGINATVIGVRDPSAGGAAWIDGFATGSSVQISSTANPSTGSQALRIADGDSSKAYHAGVDLASILDGGKPFTVSFAMAVSGVSPGTGHQAQVSLGTKNAAFEPSWFSVIYHDGNLIVLVDNASHSSTSAVNLGSYANYSPLGQHVKFDITIDPITRRYVSFVVTGSTSGKVDKTAAVQTGASLGGLPLQGSATAPYWLNFITGSNDTVTVDFDTVFLWNRE